MIQVYDCFALTLCRTLNISGLDLEVVLPRAFAISHTTRRRGQAYALQLQRCFLTRRSTIGSSHQKQLLRISGAIVGGVLLGIGAQMFILPGIETVAG